MMQCSEAQELISANQTIWLNDKAWHNPAAEYVEAHIHRCASCRGLTRQLLWGNFRRRPGPLALMRTLYAQREIERDRYGIWSSDSGRPIRRVVTTIIQQALKTGGEAVCIRTVSLLRVIEEASQSEPMADGAPPREKIRAALAEYGRLQEAVEPVRSAIWATTFAGSYWRCLFAMPEYIDAPLRADVRDLAGLPVSHPRRDAVGRITLDYQGGRYSFSVTEHPDQPGAPIYLRRAE